MNEHIALWLEKEAKELDNEIEKLKKHLMKKVPLYMLISVLVMVGIGLLAGYDFLYILKVHFLIGAVIAGFIWLCFYLQTKTTSSEKAKVAYQKAIEKNLVKEEEIDLFVKQMENGRYDSMTFQNPSTDKYPVRVLIGEDYWVYFRNLRVEIIKVEDIDKITFQNEQQRISYNVGNTRVNQNINAGMSMNMTYDTEKKPSTLYFENNSQVTKVKKAIEKQIKNSEEFFD